MADGDGRLRPGIQPSLNSNALLCATVLLFTDLLNTLRCPITHSGDHCGGVSQRHDGAVEGRRPRRHNNLLSEIFWGSDFCFLHFLFRRSNVQTVVRNSDKGKMVAIGWGGRHRGNSRSLSLFFFFLLKICSSRSLRLLCRARSTTGPTSSSRSALHTSPVLFHS